MVALLAVCVSLFMIGSRESDSKLLRAPLGFGRFGCLISLCAFFVGFFLERLQRPRATLSQREQDGGMEREDE